MKYRPDIDGLRGVAVLFVVFFHADFVFFSGGFIGVDVFFVISGFLITSIIIHDLQHDNFSLARFYEHRIRRIVPALYVVVSFSFVAAYVLFLPSDFLNFANSAKGAVIFISNHVFWGEAGYFDAPSSSKPLLHTWSLSIEEQYYVVFPLLMVITGKFLRARYLGVLILIFVGSLALSVWGVVFYPTAAFYLAPTRAWEFVIGAILALSSRNVSVGLRAHNILGFLGLALIIGSALMYSVETSFPGLAAIPPTLGAVLVIFSGLNNRSAVAQALSSRLLVGVGLISYSLYLWHVPIFVFVKAQLPYDLPMVLRLALIVLSIVVGYVSWRFIEQPFRTAQKRVGKRTVFTTAIVGGFVLFFSATYVVSDNGVPERFAENVVQVSGPEFYREKTCFMSSDEDLQNYNSDLCIAGDVSKSPTVFLWGDSHAAHYIHGLDQLAQETGFSIVQATYGGCPPVLGDGDDPTACDRFNQMALADIANRPDISTVILSANWATYSDKDQFFKNLTDTVRTVKTLGKQVLLIGPSPTYEMKVPRLLMLSKSKYGVWVGAKFPARVDETFISKLRGLGKEMDIITFFPTDLLCKGRDCKVTDKGNLLFWDASHLSAYGSLFVVKGMRGVFKAVNRNTN